MRGKRVGIAVLVVGLMVIVAALVLKFSVVEGMKQWPDDVDTTRYYEGTLHTMLNAEALETMDLMNIFLHDVPIDISRHYTTEETDGNKAIVREVIVVSGPDGETIQSTDKYYAVDRKTLEAIPDFSDDYDIPHREGMAFQFPIGGEKKDYVRWVSDFQATSPVIYQGEEEHSGIDTYVFESILTPGEIVDPNVLAVLPSELPFMLLSMLAQTLDLPAEKQAALDAVLPTLPDPVPLKYVYEYEAIYWVEPITGMNIDVQRHEVRSVALEAGGQLIPLVAVFDIEYEATEASIEEAVDDAREIKDALTLWGSTIPYVLIVVGAVLIVFGLVVLRR
jgi:hypothetical protein